MNNTSCSRTTETSRVIRFGRLRKIAQDPSSMRFPDEAAGFSASVDYAERRRRVLC
jgi:hypothetical protein